MGQPSLKGGFKFNDPICFLIEPKNWITNHTLISWKRPIIRTTKYIIRTKQAWAKSTPRVRSYNIYRCCIILKYCRFILSLRVSQTTNDDRKQMQWTFFVYLNICGVCFINPHVLFYIISTRTTNRTEYCLLRTQ